MNAREERGLIIAATTKLNETHGVWVVPSATTDGKRYMVDVRKGSCTCPDHAETGFKCKHQYAVEFTVKREQAPDGTVTETRTLTFTEKKTYTQNWAAYNLAQQTEKDRLQVLLADLCRAVPEPERKVGVSGPKPIPIADRLFACCFKVYCGVSCRRWACDMGAALETGHLSRSIHPSKVCEFFCDPDLTPILTEMVARSALPLAAIET